MSFVTVVIPCYNVAEYIDRCMQSVVNQSYKDFAVILIDDGSKDNTLNKCLAWEKRDSRITVVSKHNEGLGFTRNLGVRMAASEYITFLDADDYWQEDYMRKMIDGTENGQNDIVMCDFNFVFECDNGDTTFRTSVLRFPAGKLHDETFLLSRSRAYAWGKLYRRSLFIDNHVEQPNHAYEDVSVTPFVIALAKSVYHVDKPLYYYLRNRPTSLMNRANSLPGMILSLDELADRFHKANLFQKFRHELRRVFWGDVCFLHRVLNSQFSDEDAKKINRLKNDILAITYREFPELSVLADCRYYVSEHPALVEGVKHLVLENEQVSLDATMLSATDVAVVTDYADLSKDFTGKIICIDFNGRNTNDFERLTWDLTDEIFERVLI